MLVLTHESGIETVFGFLQFDHRILNSEGRILLELDDRDWQFGSFVDSPDPRYREIVDLFRKADYLETVLDEWT